VTDRLDDKWKGLIRGLVYPIQFDRDPIDGVDRVLEQVVRARALNASPEQYAAAVQAALQSDERLSLLIPQPHPESVIRAYLAEVGQRLTNAG
jgi:hypothetical protein